MTPLQLRVRLRDRRKQLGLTQHDVAELLGVATGTFKRWEQGIQHPALPALTRWAQALHWEVRVTHVADAEWICTAHGAYVGRYCPPCVDAGERYMREEFNRLENRIHDLTRGVA